MVALPPADVVGIGFASGADTGVAFSIAGCSDGLPVLEGSPSFGSDPGGGRSSLDAGGIIISNILSETWAHERRCFFFSSGEPDPELDVDGRGCADIGAGADGGRVIADEMAS